MATRTSISSTRAATPRRSAPPRVHTVQVPMHRALEDLARHPDPAAYIVGVRIEAGGVAYTGAGFLLSADGYFITPVHVVLPIVDNPGKYAIRTTITHRGRVFPLKSGTDISYVLEKDLLITKADLPGPSNALNIHLREEPSLGERVRLASILNGKEYRSSGTIDSIDLTNTYAYQTDTLQKNAVGHDMLLTTAPSTAGCSGGIYTDQGNNVIGMLSFGAKRGRKEVSGGPKATDIAYLIEPHFKPDAKGKLYRK